MATPITRNSVRDLVVLGEQAVAVGDEDAAPAVGVARPMTCVMAEPSAARGRVGPLEQLDLASPWRRPRGRSATSLGAGASCRARATSAHAAAAREPRPPAASAAAAQAGLGQVGGVGEAGGVADDDPDAGAAVAPGAELLDLAVVERRRRRRGLSSTKTSAKSPPGLQARCRARVCITSCIDHGTCLRLVTAGSWLDDRERAVSYPECP